MLAAAITLRHFSISNTTRLANTDVERGNGVSPSSAIRRVILASAKARLIVLLSCSTISTATPRGAAMIGYRRTAAAIGDMHHVDLGHAFEQFPIHVRGTADSRRGDRQLAGVALGISDQFRN